MTALDFTTLVLAMVGAATGVFAILWNITQFVLAGPRVKVSIKEGITDGFQVVTGPGVWTNQMHRGFGPMSPIVAIEVTNKGRLPVTISNASAVLSNQMAFSSIEDMNHRLDPYSSYTWRLPADQISTMVTVSHKMGSYTGNKVWGRAALATGKVVKSSQPIFVPGIPE
jgi:hypothetical protein